MALGCSMPRPDSVRRSRMAAWLTTFGRSSKSTSSDVTGRMVLGSGAMIAAMSLANQKGIGKYQRRRPVHDNVIASNSRVGRMCGPPSS